MSASDNLDLGFARLLEFFGGDVGEREPLQEVRHPDEGIARLVEAGGFATREAAVLIPVMRPVASASSKPTASGKPAAGAEKQGTAAAGKRSEVVLTVRSEKMKRHGGQISLPGGTREKEDENIAATALREAEEEIGLARQRVQVLGQLGQLVMPTGFRITPVVGVVEPGPEFVPCPREVAAIFSAPLELILDVAAYRDSSAHLHGQQRRVLELQWGEYRIWGATAAILHHLAQQVAAQQKNSGQQP